MLLLLAAFSLFLTLLHILPVLFDWHRHNFLIREHEIDTFKFHHDFGFIAVVRMKISVDALLLLKDGIVSGNEEDESEANQPD